MSADVRRARAYAITRSHGNLRNWEAAQWRDQERREYEDACAAARLAAEARRAPGFEPYAWADHPIHAEPPLLVTGEQEHITWEDAS